MGILVKNVTKKIGKQTILDQVSFNIDEEIVGLLGVNGAGKSTLMKILTTYILPTSGEVLLEGLDLQKQSLQIRNLIGYLPEHNPLYLNLFVREYLENISRIRKIDLNNVDHIITQTGLKKEQHKKIGALSKGYRQRVGLAQAMIHEPKILILDEPTTGLDPNQIIEIRTLIKNFSQSKTVLLSTHIMQEVEAICDRVLLLNKGKLLLNETVENILAEKGSVENAFYELTQIN